jgi:Mg-chelatase subunit ChlD
MICRRLNFFFLISALAISPVWAEDDDLLADPALEAVEALGAETTAPADESDTEITMDEPVAEDTAIEDTAIEDITIEDTAIEDTAIDYELPQVEDELPLTDISPASSLIKDVILVLDNSGSMKKNDPGFLASKAVHEFLSSLDDDSRVAVIIFDQSVRVVVPLTEITEESRPAILNSIEKLDYRGLYTDSPAAIEKAIYELKNSGRENAKKLIVFMTDGIVDTGNVNRDVEKSRWLQQDLAAGAADAEIQIFSIAFTDEADFQLIQALAQRTGGEYYRALKPEDLQNVFTQVHTIINKVPEPEPVIIPPTPVEPPQPVEVAPPPPVIIEVPVPAQRMDEEEELRSMMILVALSVLIIAVIIMVLMLIRGSRKKGVEDEYAQEAFLNDINNYTTQSSYKLSSKPTMLGRVAGTDTEHLNYIVIPQTTIGRRHALIEYKDFAYWIIDQGSINGTFVNDQLITSETRLKHGDRIRLHKLEFEFVMPEMVDAGMTMVSKTVMAADGHAAVGEEATIARGSNHSYDDDMDLPEPEFDLTGGLDSSVNPDEEDTIIKESSAGDDSHQGAPDATIMLDSDEEEMDEDDATIRPDMDDDNGSDLTVDNFRDTDKKK